MMMKKFSHDTVQKLILDTFYCIISNKIEGNGLDGEDRVLQSYVFHQFFRNTISVKLLGLRTRNEVKTILYAFLPSSLENNSSVMHILIHVASPFRHMIIAFHDYNTFDAKQMNCDSGNAVHDQHDS